MGGGRGGSRGGGGGGLPLILGSLSIDVREPLTATESRMFLFWRIFVPHNGREKLLSGVCDCDVTNAIASKRSKRKKSTFRFPSVAHERLCCVCA